MTIEKTVIYNDTIEDYRLLHITYPDGSSIETEIDMTKNPPETVVKVHQNDVDGGKFYEKRFIEGGEDQKAMEYIDKTRMKLIKINEDMDREIDARLEEFCNERNV